MLYKPQCSKMCLQAYRDDEDTDQSVNKSRTDGAFFARQQVHCDLGMTPLTCIQIVYYFNSSQSIAG